MTASLDHSDRRLADPGVYFNNPDIGNARPALWPWWVGLLLIVVGQFILSIIVYLLAFYMSPVDWQNPVGSGSRGGFADYLALFAVFIPAFLMPILIWRYLNGLPVIRLITVTPHIRWGFMVRAMIVVVAVYIVTLCLDYQIRPQEFAGMERQTDWQGWAILGVITLILCPVQSSSEEILLRGYGSHLLVRTFERLKIGSQARLWIAYVLTSCLFASLHLGNPEAEGQVWSYMAGTALFGLAMCILVHFEGGLESAIGYHIANNIFVFSIFGYSDPMLPNSAIFWMPEISIGWGDVAEQTVLMMVIVAIILFWNRRKRV